MNGVLRLIKIYIMRILIRILYIFPIKNNRIIFNAYKGTQYACNPKYITEKLLELYRNEFEIIWAFDDPEKYKGKISTNIKMVRFSSIKRFYYEATSKVSINNVGSFSWLPLRKGQEHINTWHSGLDLECCGMNESANTLLIKYTIALSGKETTLFLSSNRVFSEYSVIEQFGYSGLILNAGLPRSDDLLNGRQYAIKEKVRQKLGISRNAVVLMYAPTWRYGGTDAMPEMNYKLLSQAMKETFGDDYWILNRSHHLTNIKEVENDKRVIDTTSYPNIEELVISCDILISDYSSVLWDGAVARKVLIQYAPDAEQFEKDRGLYVPVGKWGIPAFFSMQELCDAICSINLKVDTKYSEFLLTIIGSYETGRAAELVSKWIWDRCFESENENEYSQYLTVCSGKSDDTIIKKMNNNPLIY